jgi:hypothetical protein
MATYKPFKILKKHPFLEFAMPPFFVAKWWNFALKNNLGNQKKNTTKEKEIEWTEIVSLCGWENTKPARKLDESGWFSSTRTKRNLQGSRMRVVGFWWTSRKRKLQVKLDEIGWSRSMRK